MKAYLGLDVGSLTVKFALLDGEDKLLSSLYLPVQGDAVGAIKSGLQRLGRELAGGVEIAGAAVTGSARRLGGDVIGADLVKNEITCHALAAVKSHPSVQTVMEIGGQDSKIIIIRDGLVADFGMNTVCAAGTGSFLDHQAARLNLSIEEFSRRALLSKNPVPITAKCTVFAESDMIHRQQTGHAIDDIIYGLCRALARNYLASVVGSKELLPPVLFQGGVAFNRGIVRALEEELGMAVVVPRHHEVMGAIGAARLAREEASFNGGATRFKGFDIGGEAPDNTPADVGVYSGTGETGRDGSLT